MSVVCRVIDGVEYLHVRRKVKGVQRQRFFAVTGLRGKALSAMEDRANRLDGLLEAEQGQDNENFMGLFWQEGRFLFIRLLPPNLKNGWRVIAYKHTNDSRFVMSRSVDKHGINSAFNQVFDALLLHHGFNANCQAAELLRLLWLKEIKKGF